MIFIGCFYVGRGFRKMADLKRIACGAIDSAAEELHALSDAIWNHPELGFHETHAHEVITKFLIDKGFQASNMFYTYVL